MEGWAVRGHRSLQIFNVKMDPGLAPGWKVGRAIACSTFHFDVGGFDDFAPLRDFFAEKLSELLGRIADRIDADLNDSVVDVLAFDDVDDGAVERHHDLARRACRREQT